MSTWGSKLPELFCQVINALVEGHVERLKETFTSWAALALFPSLSHSRSFGYLQ